MTRAVFMICVVALVASPLSLALRAAQRGIQVQGTFVEPLSRLPFPTEVRGWKRTRVLQYPEPAGYSVTYELRLGNGVTSTATAFVYPHGPLWPPTVKEHFLVTLNELRSLSSASEVVAQQSTPAGAGRGVETWLGTVLFRGGLGSSREPIVAFLTLTRVRNVWLKWRIDAPAGSPPDVPAKMQELVESLVPK